MAEHAVKPNRQTQGVFGGEGGEGGGGGMILKTVWCEKA